MGTTMTVGEEAAARCADCRLARDNGYSGCAGWHIDSAGRRHNHIIAGAARVAELSRCMNIDGGPTNSQKEAAAYLVRNFGGSVEHHLANVRRRD